MGKDGGKETKGASGEGGTGAELEAGNFVYSVQHMLLRLLGKWPE